MRTIRKLVHREVIGAVSFVTFGFLALFFFFDLVDELRWVNRSPTPGNDISLAVLSVALRIPSHLYELLPITVLIGTIFVMARLAQSSEFTIMRTSGLGPGRALRALLTLGLGFVLVTFAVGDYLAPLSDKAAQLIKARAQGRLSTGATGAWLKERQGDRSYAVNVRAIIADGSMQGVRVFEFDDQGRMAAQIHAPSARFVDDGWMLLEARRSVFASQDSPNAHITQEESTQLLWPTTITSDMVAAAVLKPDRMATIDLFQYISHLKDNGQSAQRYEIEFWRKVFYPLSCLVMVVLALPFAYLHFRSGSIAGYVFGGVMAGISFFLLNNLFGFAGNLQNWSPWLTAAAPGIIYSLASLAAFGWLVLRR